jgi:hypothetical protein
MMLIPDGRNAVAIVDVSCGRYAVHAMAILQSGTA